MFNEIAAIERVANGNEGIARRRDKGVTALTRRIWCVRGVEVKNAEIGVERKESERAIVQGKMEGLYLPPSR